MITLQSENISDIVILDEVGNRYTIVQEKALKKHTDESVWATGLDWVVEETGIKDKSTIRNKVLLPFKKELDAKNGGCVLFPSTDKHHWRFNKEPFREFLRKKFSNVMNNMH